MWNPRQSRGLTGGWFVQSDDGAAKNLGANACDELANGLAAGCVCLTIALAPDDADDLAMGVDHTTAAVAGAHGAGDCRRCIRGSVCCRMSGDAAGDAAK